jgi:hypothetical protein
LTLDQRFGEVVSLIITALIVGYFRRLWTIDAGYFTSAFGPPEQFWFFGPMILSFAAPTMRILVGRRNPARLFEIVTDVFMVIGAIWRLREFPFDFSHLGDALPGNLPALLNWAQLARQGGLGAAVGGRRHRRNRRNGAVHEGEPAHDGVIDQGGTHSSLARAWPPA